MKDGRLVKAMAGFVRADDGRYFGFMELQKSARYPLILREFKRFLQAMPQEYGVSQLHVLCDETYPRAAAFLARLGFAETGETIEGQKVWIWQASKQP